MIDALPGMCPQAAVQVQLQGVSTVRVTDVGLKRGRRNCLQAHRPQDRYFTMFACSSCRVQLCKTNCFNEYHQGSI